MNSFRTYFIAVIVLAFAIVPNLLISESMSAGTSSPQTNRNPVQPAKFKRTVNPIPNRYFVVLNDDVVTAQTTKARRNEVNEKAEEISKAHGGKVGFIYETALNGFSVELPSEMAAIAISKNPRVKFVEEVGTMQLLDVQFSPPWGLDRIDQSSLPVNGQYVFNATGAGVRAYVIDSGIRTTHVDFGGRAVIAADFIHPLAELPCTVTPTNNDCGGHGTHVAGTVGGATYGVAKSVEIRSVKVCAGNFRGCPNDSVIAGVNFVTSEHLANPSIPAVANVSLGGFPNETMDLAVRNSINAGVTYAVAAGNENTNASNFSPARLDVALTVSASGPTDERGKRFDGTFFANFGTVVDIFAPGQDVLSADFESDTDAFFASGTSMASPHAAGAIALYLQGRTARTDCNQHPISGPATTSGGSISTCPDRVNQFIKSNASLNKLSSIGTGSPNRLLFTGSLPTTNNPIDNQRFFVWQHYADFLVNEPEPDVLGLDFWTGNITGTCGTGFNDNNGCTHTKRIDVSRAFWAAAFPSLVTNGGNQLTNNAEFVHRCYEVYLRRSVPDTDGGFQFWLSVLNSHGNPAGQGGINHLIDAFMSSMEYRQRFGQP